MDVFALCNLTSYFYPGGRAWFVTPLCDILVEILGDLCFLLKAFAAHSLLTVLFTSQSTEILQFNSELLVNIKFASVSTVEGVHLSSELILPCKMGFWCVSDTEVNTTCDVCNITSLCVWKHVHACTWKVFTQFDIWSIWRLSSNFWFKKIKIQVLSRCCFNFPLDQTKIHWIFICQSYADNGLSGSEINIKTVLSVTFISTGVKWLILETTVCGTSASVIFCILFNGNKKGYWFHWGAWLSYLKGLCQHLKLQLISFLLSGVFWYLEEGLKCTGVLPSLPHVAPRARTTGEAGWVGYCLTKRGLFHYKLICVMLAAGSSWMAKLNYYLSKPLFLSVLQAFYGLLFLCPYRPL